MITVYVTCLLLVQFTPFRDLLLTEVIDNIIIKIFELTNKCFLYVGFPTNSKYMLACQQKPQHTYKMPSCQQIMPTCQQKIPICKQIFCWQLQKLLDCQHIEITLE